MLFIDLSGQRFGRLTVFNPIRGGREVKWDCLCDCGNTAVVLGHCLRSGDTASCGCIRRETTAARGHNHLRHGAARLGKRTPGYGVWTRLRNRCTNPNHQDWENYGGRGITVCTRWDTFENFLADMGSRPSPKHSIERREVDGNYEPSNCEWATLVTQANNKRRNHKLTFAGKTLSISQWARELEVSKQVLLERVRSGWSVEDVLLKPKYARRSAE